MILYVIRYSSLPLFFLARVNIGAVLFIPIFTLLCNERRAWVYIREGGRFVNLSHLTCGSGAVRSDRRTQRRSAPP